MAGATAVSRRGLLKRLGLASALALGLPELDRVLAFQRDSRKTAVPSGVLSAAEAEMLGAVCARIIPTDESGPGAAEAHAARYIDRALGGWLASARAEYTAGLAQIDDAATTRYGRKFVDLTPADQDAVLSTTEQTPFFALMRMHTIQGTFCDPVYGGNQNFVGWDLIRYPGIRLNVAAAEQRMNTAIKPIRRSAYDYAMFANTLGAAHAH